MPSYPELRLNYQAGARARHYIIPGFTQRASIANMSEKPKDAHDSWIKTPRQLIIAVVTAFVVPIVVIMLLITYVKNGEIRSPTDKKINSDEAVRARIGPIATVDIKDASGPRVYQTGAAVYKQVCAVCHVSGVAGAPKFGDAAAWRPHIAGGMEHMMASVLKGKNAMPPRAGTHPDDVSDYELERALVHMVNASGGQLPEPAPPPEPKNP
jgi:cytochrome c5